MSELLDKISERVVNLDKIEEETENEIRNRLKFEVPKRVSRRYIDMGRQLGKTTYMIKNLPADGKFTILYTGNITYQKNFLDVIKKLRPDIQLEEIKFETVRTLSQLYAAFDVPNKENIFIDNAVWDSILMQFIESLYK